MSAGRIIQGSRNSLSLTGCWSYEIKLVCDLTSAVYGVFVVRFLLPMIALVFHCESDCFFSEVLVFRTSRLGDVFSNGKNTDNPFKYPVFITAFHSSQFSFSLWCTATFNLSHSTSAEPLVLSVELSAFVDYRRSIFVIGASVSRSTLKPFEGVSFMSVVNRRRIFVCIIWAILVTCLRTAVQSAVFYWRNPPWLDSHVVTSRNCSVIILASSPMMYLEY